MKKAVEAKAYEPSGHSCDDAPKTDAENQRLQQMGYKQEMVRRLDSICGCINAALILQVRGFNAFSNFGISFSIISVLTGVTGGFNLGAVNGGPVVQVWGWIFVCLFSMTVAVSLAEICSAYPTAGSLYYWSAQLAGPADSALASWITGQLYLFFGVACDRIGWCR
ncbi:hypothetical protein MMC29_000325 [Sticta canariensis]|nr:hypothetical protein [Sticta canariensis]